MTETKQMCPKCSNIDFNVIVSCDYGENGLLIESGLKFRCVRCGKVSDHLIDMVIL